MRYAQINFYLAIFFIFIIPNAVRAEESASNLTSLMYTLEERLNQPSYPGSWFQVNIRLCQSTDGYYGMVQMNQDGSIYCFNSSQKESLVSGNHKTAFRILSHKEIMARNIFAELSELAHHTGSTLSWGQNGFYYSLASSDAKSIFILTRPGPHERAADASQDKNTTNSTTHPITHPTTNPTIDPYTIISDCYFALLGIVCVVIGVIVFTACRYCLRDYDRAGYTRIQ